MRFDPGKAWPHPVLRPPSYGDDYPRAEFEVEINVGHIQGSTAVEVNALFELSDPDLLQLVAVGAARYVLLIKASKTHFRDLIESNGKYVNKTYSSGDLSGRAEFIPFLVCTQDLTDFRADGWHPDFAGRNFDIAAGAVDAAAEIAGAEKVLPVLRDRREQFVAAGDAKRRDVGGIEDRNRERVVDRRAANLRAGDQNFLNLPAASLVLGEHRPGTHRQQRKRKCPIPFDAKRTQVHD